MEEFVQPKLRKIATAKLRGVSTAVLVPRLIKAVKSGGRYKKDHALRYAALRLLLDVGPEKREQGRLIVRADLAAMFLDGLGDVDLAVRGLCATAIPVLDPSVSAGAVPALALLLSEENPSVATSAIVALGKLGARSKAALPELGKILFAVDVDVAARFQRLHAWYKTMPDPWRDEIGLRSRAAFSRMQIGGLGIDCAAYSRLDWKGQVAVMQAQKRPIGSLQSPGKQPSPTFNAQQWLMVVNLLSSVVNGEKVPENYQLRAVAGLSIIIAATHPFISATAASREALVKLHGHGNPKIRDAALMATDGR